MVRALSVNVLWSYLCSLQLNILYLFMTRWCSTSFERMGQNLGKNTLSKTKIGSYLMKYMMQNTARDVNLGRQLAPVPLSIFRSNSKFDENSKHSSVKYTRSITTIFCTRHDSVTVVTCAKYRCDRSGVFNTRAFWIFIEFRIRSKYA